MFKFSRRKFFVILALVFIIPAIYLLFKIISPKPIALIFTNVDSGPVRQLVSVSGVINAEDTANLAFPLSGVVQSVFVRKGDVVATSTVLATLTNETLLAEQTDALAGIARAQAELAQLYAGTSDEERDVTAENVSLKTTILKTTRETEMLKVNNARKALLSTSLTAYSTDSSEDAVAPTISGTYECLESGQYVMDVFRSSAESNYSFNLSGLESGTFEATFDQANSFGDCGLRAQFTNGSLYAGSQWVIDIPNKKSASYITLKNNYDLAQNQALSSIAIAEQELVLAKATAKDTIASTRPEVLAKAEAELKQAQAKLARTEAELALLTLKAPFAGTIISVDILPGETVTTTPVITLQSSLQYELLARIPEVDIGKLAVGQKAEVVFDTKDDEILTAIIDYLSPNATTIDGVAYYEARIVLDKNPLWLRSGLNADIDIIIAEEISEARLPSRFVTEAADGSYTILRMVGNVVASSTIDVLFRGNDGFISVSGIKSGEQVIAP